MDRCSFSYTKSDRILKRARYLEIYSRGKRFRNRLFYIYFLENGLENSRLGLTVSRKVGSSVIQNRIKRHFREIFRKTGKLINPPSDVVINATRGTVGKDYNFLQEAFRNEVEKWEEVNK